jgi:acyl-CoA thioester hydrolase
MNKNAAGETGASAKVLGAEIEMSVPFYDLDPLGVVWHGNYYKYFELARAEFMKSIRFDIDEMRQSGYVWPVTKSDCSYISPLRYDMKIMVRAELQEEEHRLGLRYWITEKETGKVLAKGHTIQAAVHIDTWEMCFITPDTLLSRIRDARNRRSL